MKPYLLISGVLLIFSVHSFSQHHILGNHAYWVNDVAFNHDGTLLVSAGANEVKVWSIPDGRLVKTFSGHSNYVSSVAFSLVNDYIASGSWDKTIKIWRPVNKYSLKTLRGHSENVECVVFSPDGELLASGSLDRTIRLWRMPEGSLYKIIPGHSGQVNSICFSPDGQLLASASEEGNIIITDILNGRFLRKIDAHINGVNAIRFNSNGKFLISGGGDRKIRVWNVLTGKLVEEKIAHSRPVTSLAPSSDGQFIFSGSDDGSLRFWTIGNLDKSQKTFYHQKGRIKTLTSSPKDKFLAFGGGDMRIHLYHLESIPEVKEAHALPAVLITKVEFNDKGSFFPNNRLDGAEDAGLEISVQNNGQGSAYDVHLRISCDNSFVNLEPVRKIGDIAPDGVKRITIPLAVSMDAADSKADIHIETREKRGYHARPVRIMIPVRHLDKPVLAISSFTLNDGTIGQAAGNGNGIVENGETIEITAFVKNTGVGPALNTMLHLDSVSAGAKIIHGTAKLGTISPSTTAQGKVVVTVPRTFKGRQLQMVFKVEDEIGASKILRKHSYALNTRLPVIVFDEHFYDKSGVQVYNVNNGEAYILEIIPRNEGKITAKAVKVRVNASVDVKFSDSQKSIGTIQAGTRAAEQRFNFSLPRHFNSEQVQLKIYIEQSDFPDLARTITIPCVHKSPKLVIKEILSTSSGDAEIHQGETAYLDFVIENHGDLDAEGVHVTLDITHPDIDSPEPSKAIGRIPAGGKTQTLRFTFLVKTAAAPGPLSARLGVQQSDGFPDLEKKLTYSIKKLGAEIVTVTPAEKPVTVQPFISSTHTNIPPVVFLSPKQLATEGKSFDPYINLEIQIKDDKPMLSFEPEIRVNGRLQTREKGLRGIGIEERQIQNIEKVRLIRRVELDEGFNHIEVRVYDSDNEMGMEAVEIEYLPRRTDIWALVIGIGDYQHDQIDRLDYADNDAQSFYDFFSSPTGFSLQADRVKLLLNQQATRENILKEMEWITNHAFKNDLVIIYMALHGIVEQGELYFMAHNSDPHNLLASGVKKSDLENLLQRRMKSNKIVWFADACHSGSIGQDPLIALRANRAGSTNRLLREIAKARNGLALFMSAMGMEFSQESSKWGGGHGVFTYYLLKGLRGGADRNEDRYVSILELYDYVSKQVNEATAGKQNPVLYGQYDQGLKLSVIK
jgi:hypothetical protein